MIDYKLIGKVAIVTGGTAGIGFAAAQVMIRSGASVVITGRDEAKGRAAEASLGAAACFVAADAGDPASAKRAVAFATSRFGGVDILFNNAGGGGGGQIDEESPESWQQVINTNLGGTAYMCAAALPEMRRRGGGSIVNMSSISAFTGPLPTHPMYAISNSYIASKGGVLALTRSLAAKHGHEAIRVNCVTPGLIMTAPIRQLDAALGEPFMDHWLGTQALKITGQPEDVGEAVAFLASDAARFITGQNLVIDGGAIISTGRAMS
ncbi:MAG: SDR family NAD(P)-dependent oxidoreductase [Dehalococcoidia bacterium]